MTEQSLPFDFICLRQQLWQDLIGSFFEPEAARKKLNELSEFERFWAFPGREVLNKLTDYLTRGRVQQARQLAQNSLRELQRPRSKGFEPFSCSLDKLDHPSFDNLQPPQGKPCIELLVLHPNPPAYQRIYLGALSALQTERDEFYYEVLLVDNLADAVTALLANSNIQATLAISGCSTKSSLALANQTLEQSLCCLNCEPASQDSALLFQQITQSLRPELEQYYLAEVAFVDLPRVYFERFDRIFYHEYPFKDLHYHLMNGVRERFNTPFYNALHAYSQKPKGVFHALPISRASSIKDSLWLRDFYQFYGDNLFFAETSSTQGGMDSLLNPKGIIKNSQNKAAACFGAQQTFFVTNGTSTSNKIVMQANLNPGDIVLVSSDCHKSVPYGVVLCGAHSLFLQANAVEQYDLYGAVALDDICQQLRRLEAQGQLHRVKQIILTNSTFDGLLYNVEQYMMAILAIKPDIIFHWDEAWFAHAHFNCLYQKRHAMSVAQRLQERFTSESYRNFYAGLSEPEKEQWPNPEQVVLRVYATQSTHKTLSCFRQGSMIHIFDQAFEQSRFMEAFYTHTSTSPNYQLLASLDIARRQMNLEGFQRTQTSLRLAWRIRNALENHPQLSQVFRVLKAHDIYPAQLPLEIPEDYNNLLGDFQEDKFVIDPSRITVDIRNTSMNGDAFRQLLIDKYDIQVNKTSQYTVLFIVNIGTQEETTHYLLEVLKEIAERVLSSTRKQSAFVEKSSPMPSQRNYHPAFSELAGVVDLRKAHYAANNRSHIHYLQLNSELMERARQGHSWVSAAFVTPYPPGFPILVPGQLIDYPFLLYFSAITAKEIHGYHPELGLKVFSEQALCQPDEV